MRMQSSPLAFNGRYIDQGMSQHETTFKILSDLKDVKVRYNIKQPKGR